MVDTLDDVRAAAIRIDASGETDVPFASGSFQAWEGSGSSSATLARR